MEIEESLYKLDLNVIDNHILTVLISWRVLKNEICSRCNQISMRKKINLKLVTSYYCKRCEYYYSTITNTILHGFKIRFSVFYLILDSFINDRTVEIAGNKILLQNQKINE